MSQLRDWRGRTVLVTGASSGIGRAIAGAAARRGARLHLLARTVDALEDAASEARSLGAADAKTHALDVRDRRATARTLADIGPETVDVAVLSAGIGAHRTFLEQSLEEAEQILDTNVRGVLYTAHPIARAMAERGRGWIVFLGSIAGLLPVPGEAIYSASKHAIVGLAESMSVELEDRGVHVLTACPGAVRTAFVRPEDGDRISVSARRTAIEPEIVADAIVEALAQGQRRIVVPRKLEVAVRARAIAPNLVRGGIKRATRDGWKGR